MIFHEHTVIYASFYLPFLDLASKKVTKAYTP